MVHNGFGALLCWIYETENYLPAPTLMNCSNFSIRSVCPLTHNPRYGLVLSITEPDVSHCYFLMNLFLAILPELDFEIII